MRWLPVFCILYGLIVESRPLSQYVELQETSKGALIFNLEETAYMANLRYPEVTVQLDRQPPGYRSPMTVINLDESRITGPWIEREIASYLDGDNVFTENFLDAVYLSSTTPAHLDSSALEYLKKIETKQIFIGKGVSLEGTQKGVIRTDYQGQLPAGPSLAVLDGASLALARVYRLYEDEYRAFLYGSYELNDGTGRYTSLDVSYPGLKDVAIPVSSRIRSRNSSLPFAGFRVGIKDLFDMKGLKTSGGSRAYERITKSANATAPSIQRIVDLGGELVGKNKLAQFASGADPWEWQDEHYPFNPRGDGWLTCSASSSGGACAVAAYDWLDYAIGTDTGSSMRRPAAVAGVYGQRPSQGLMSLENVMPLGAATDTAGVFSRDPHAWAHFAKHWYIPELHQSPNITGLSPLVVPDSNAFPKTILYPTDYLPLNNSAAQPILEAFISNLTSLFGMQVQNFNFTQTVRSIPDPLLNNLTALTGDSNVGLLTIRTQYEQVAKPLIETWSSQYDGRFPPIDPARRQIWQSYNETANFLEAYNTALERRNAAVEWYETNFQFSTPNSCSESIMLYDIGTGGLPSYREEALNDSPEASFLAVTPEGAEIAGANICPLYGCADFTVPIGQVRYMSSVTMREEMVPVTIGMVVKRGCDFVLYNLIERLADEGVLKEVKTGRTAF